MIEITGSLYRLVYDSKRFFKNAQYYHIVITVFLFGTGIAAIVLSSGSNGNAQVPYFFSAFIAGAWHIVSAVLCQLCIYYLSGDGSRSSTASTLVRVYSIVCSVFVLFNVMGVVFTVVNGMCIESQMCYYDKNYISNRTMAILLILEHCVSILASIFLAKRAHLIDSELSADVSIKLNHHFNFSRKSKRSSASEQQSDTSRSQQTTPENKNESGLSEVQNKGGHVLTTIEISAMTHRKTHRRSKSQPITLKQLGLEQTKIEGQEFSIYSDSESKVKGEHHKKKRRFIPSKSKSNRVKATIEINTDKRVRSKSVGDDLDCTLSEDESLSSFATRSSIEERMKQLNKLEKRTTAPLPVDQNEAGDLFYVKPAPDAENWEDKQQKLFDKQSQLQKEQEKLHREQAKLHEKQRKLFQVQQQQQTISHPAPPPYECFESPDNSRTILHVEEGEDDKHGDVPL
ncbi:uncharacterized protein LOC123548808 [Mercenaria mercenaria]|uniref:uncharacterized protein LOC123548808 n=1 Tax=Mercenaria mercenaria TaxID=6596 RepID=UPI00234E8786|nr:uncharacterized protein LOC123548808 [Mercenaria mercenaria]